MSTALDSDEALTSKPPKAVPCSTTNGCICYPVDHLNMPIRASRAYLVNLLKRLRLPQYLCGLSGYGIKKCIRRMSTELTA